MEDYDNLVADYNEERTPTYDGLQEVNSLLAEMEDEETGFGFKADLIMMALRVASSSGGSWFSGSISG